MLSMAKIIDLILGLLTLAGFTSFVVAIVLNLMEVGYPIPILLLGTGTGCFLLAGVPWAHMPGSRGLKAAVLGLVGFAAGGAAGFYLGYTITPKRPDDWSPLIFGFAGMWAGGIVLALLGVRWAILVHRKYTA